MRRMLRHVAAIMGVRPRSALTAIKGIAAPASRPGCRRPACRSGAGRRARPASIPPSTSASSSFMWPISTLVWTSRSSLTTNTFQSSPARNSALIGRCRQLAQSQIGHLRDDAVAIAEARIAGIEVEHGVDSLLLDAERRDLGEGGRVDPPHRGLERLAAAPVGDQRLGAGMDAHRIGREQVDDDLEPGRVADIGDLGAGLHGLRALGVDGEHDAVDGRDEVDAAAALHVAAGVGLDQPCLGAGEFCLAQLDRRRCGVDGSLLRLHGVARLLKRRRGDHAGAVESGGAVEVVLRHLQRRLRLLQVDLGDADRSLGGVARRQQFVPGCACRSEAAPSGGSRPPPSCRA